jgi:hypothetical protein
MSAPPGLAFLRKRHAMAMPPATRRTSAVAAIQYEIMDASQKADGFHQMPVLILADVPAQDT